MAKTTEMSRVASEEGERVELKQQFTRRIGHTLSAFANTCGGSVYIGVSDAGQVVGVEDINQLKSSVQHLINNCQPSIAVAMHKEMPVKSREPILVITVQEGGHKPYAYNNVCYTRDGALTRPMHPEEIIAAAEQGERIKFDNVACKKFDYQKHFDQEKLQWFLKKAELPPCNNEKEIIKTLDNLGVLVTAKRTVHPVFNNAGVLFFAKDLHKIFRHAEVACASYKNDEKTYVIDSAHFNRDLLHNIDSAMQFIKKSLRLEYHIIAGQLQRQELLEIPEDALREALINAVTHRDYVHDSTNVTVEIFTNRVEISNIGTLPKGLDAKDFGKKSVPRNVLIADLMRRAKYVERFGIGIGKIKRLIRNANLPAVKFDYGGNFFTATFWRKPLHSNNNNGNGGNGRSPRLLKLLDSISAGTFHKPSFAISEGVSQRAVERDLKYLREQGFIVFEGATKTGRYRVTSKHHKK